MIKRLMISKGLGFWYCPGCDEEVPSDWVDHRQVCPVCGLELEWVKNEEENKWKP